MDRLRVLVVLFLVALAGLLFYLVVAHTANPSACESTSGSSPPLGPPPFALGLGNTTRVGSIYLTNFTVVTVPAGLTVGQLALRVQSPSGSNAGGVNEFVVWDRSGQAIASANGTTSAWTNGASAPLTYGDVLSVESTATLAGDYLQAAIPLPCGHAGTLTIQIG